MEISGLTKKLLNALFSFERSELENDLTLITGPWVFFDPGGT